MKKITRFELIGKKAKHEKVIYEDMYFDVQDFGRTLKVFRGELTEIVEDKNIEVGIYYYIYDGKKVYDTDEMEKEFQLKLKALQND